MQNILFAIQIVVAIGITAAILLQAQGTGLGSTWGGGGETYHTRRGLEKVLFYLTIGLIVVFTLISVASILV
jgi:preprotein translocase subunit SecG